MVSPMVSHPYGLAYGLAELQDTNKTLEQKLKNTAVTSSVALGFLLLLGHYLRKRSRWLRALHLPAVQQRHAARQEQRVAAERGTVDPEKRLAGGPV